MSSTSWDTAMMLVGLECPPRPVKTVPPREFVEFSAGYFNVHVNCLTKSGRKDAAVSDMRHMVRHWLRKSAPGLTLAEIARCTGWCDHSSVISSLKRHSDLMATDPRYRVQYTAFEQAVNRECFQIQKP